MKRGVFRIMSRISSAVLVSGVSAPGAGGAGRGAPGGLGGRGEGEGALRFRDSSKSSGSSSIRDIVWDWS
jgi:hypothetical protein